MEPRCRRSPLRRWNGSRHGQRGTAAVQGRRALAVVALVLVAPLAGCGVDEEPAVDDEVGVEDELVDGVGVEVVFDGQPLWVGEEVTVSGEVIDLVDRHGFRLESDTATETLLVVTPEATAVKKDTIVQVTGTVHLLDVAALEDELGVELDEEVFAPFEDEVALVALAVEQ